MKALVLVEHEGGALRPATRNTLNCALQAAGAADLLVVGSGCAQVAQAAARLAGVGQVLVADAAHLAEPLAENLAAQVLACAPGYTHVLAAASSTGKGVMPRVAALLGCAQVSEALAVVDARTFRRPIYAGNAIATVRSEDPVTVITVRTTAFEPVADGESAAPVQAVAPVADSGKVQFVSREQAKSERPELQSARVVVSGGRGLGSSENFLQILEPLAQRLDAALGASRAAVDAGFAPNDWQVGQTGKIVAPQLYLAVGISGAIQHLAGMKDSKVIVAINKDPEAPIFQVADYGLVADLFQAVPELLAALGD
jgi:electron transfer flavoprotein alpha subunit